MPKSLAMNAVNDRESLTFKRLGVASLPTEQRPYFFALTRRAKKWTTTIESVSLDT